MVASEIWRVSGYRFTVKDHRVLKSGHRTRFYCSQDQARKKKSKASQDPDVRNRDNVGMKRYPCSSKLVISCRSFACDDELTVTVRLAHGEKHVCYFDVSMPEAALDMIRDYVEWLTPGALVTKVQRVFPSVTAMQVYKAWVDMSSTFWRRADAQLPSTAKLLEEFRDDVHLFHPEDVPDGIEMLCWGMKKIAEPLRGNVVEIGVDATCNIWSSIAYWPSTIMPVSRSPLTAWAKCVRDKYGVMPQFTHVDKDMAEIGMLKEAVRTRLASKKLSTTPYDPRPANAEFSFIDITFIPQGQADGEEYEGGVPDSITPVTITMSNGLRITINMGPHHYQPSTPATAAAKENEGPPVDTTARDAGRGARQPLNDVNGMHVVRTRAAVAETEKHPGDKDAAPHPHNSVQTRAGRVTKPTRHPDAADPAVLAAAMKARTGQASAAKPAVSGRKRPKENDHDSAASSDDGSDGENEDQVKNTKRTFCPSRYRDPIVNMLEKHYCAHPQLPGYAPPNPEGIRRWAVMQMYKFCVEHGLPEVWAYLWENWYRPSRWELWARSVHKEIPILKTTMIAESHWRLIKHDFLRHFHMPRCDLLAWILVVKLAPRYYQKLDRMLTETGRYPSRPAAFCSANTSYKRWNPCPLYFSSRSNASGRHPSGFILRYGLCQAIAAMGTCLMLVRGSARSPPPMWTILRTPTTTTTTMG
ncbi:hypothetical protein B0H14DRAFT_2944863 [Mycena olivaceomarginata]|nr:hypothetical protein B0H14DRAFT_2944863 [Mycena olivaceomarginata]